MHAVCVKLFPSPVVEKPVENVEKSTVSTGTTCHFPVFPHLEPHSLFMHKVCFFCFFQNYVATKFPGIFAEISSKYSEFGDLRLISNADVFFYP